MNETSSMELVTVSPHGPGMLMPLADASGARAAIAAYEALKAAIVRPDDIQRIQGRDFLKKAFWRRVATCFGLSLELVREERGFDESGHLFYSVIYRAVAPNGRSMEADGMYVNGEKKDKAGQPVYMTEHIIRATAHTRAKNRAISDLVGGGEVSAEEMQDDDGVVESQPSRSASAKPVAKNGNGNKPASSAQLERIRKGCELLGQPVPEGPQTAESADKLISTLRTMYQQRQADAEAKAADEHEPTYTFTDAGAAAASEAAHDLAGAFGNRGA